MLAWDRYAGMLNNPVRYTDKSGHHVCDENGQCYDHGKRVSVPRRGSAPKLVLDKDDPYKLTTNGKGQEWLYNLFLSYTDGWWQSYIHAGTDPLLLFVAIIFSMEASPLWQNPHLSGWGMGGAGDPSGYFIHTIGSRYFLWGKDPRGQGGQGAPESLYKNALLNLLGGFSGTARGIWGGANEDGKELRELMPKEEWNPDFLSMTAEVLPKTPYKHWLDDGMWDWGNSYRDGYIYRYPTSGPIDEHTFFIYPP